MKELEEAEGRRVPMREGAVPPAPGIKSHVLSDCEGIEKMAESVFHFAVGLSVGTAAFLPALVRRFKTGDPMAPFFVRWFAVAFGLAVLAIIPGLFAKIGLPDRFLAAWWMNIFVLFPILNSLKHGGFIVGTAMILGCGAVMYISLLLAIARRRRGGTVSEGAG